MFVYLCIYYSSSNQDTLYILWPAVKFHCILSHLPFGACSLLMVTTASAPSPAQNTMGARALGSAREWSRGTQPMDQSKHSHQGWNNSHQLMAYTQLQERVWSNVQMHVLVIVGMLLDTCSGLQAKYLKPGLNNTVKSGLGFPYTLSQLALPVECQGMKGMDIPVKSRVESRFYTSIYCVMQHLQHRVPPPHIHTSKVSNMYYCFREVGKGKVSNVVLQLSRSLRRRLGCPPA